MTATTATEAMARWRLRLPWLWLCLIVLLALLPGLIDRDRACSPDSARYTELGQRLWRGEGFTNADGSPHAFTPPLYPLLAGIAGPALLAIQGVLFLLCCHRLRRLSIRVGVAATDANRIALLCAISPLPLIYTGRFLSEIPFLWLLLCGCDLVFASLAWRRDGPPGAGQWRPWQAAGGGFLIGLAALTRAVLLPWLCLWPLFIAVRRGQRRLLIFALAGILLPVGGWSLRNAAEFGYLAPNPATATTGYYAALAAPDTTFSNALVHRRGELTLANPFAEATAQRAVAAQLIRAYPLRFGSGLVQSLPLLFAPPLPELMQNFGLRQEPTGLVSRISAVGWPAAVNHYWDQLAHQAVRTGEQNGGGPLILPAVLLIGLWDLTLSFCGLIGLGRLVFRRREARQGGRAAGDERFLWLFFGSLTLVLLLAPAGVYQPRFRVPLAPVIAVLAYPVILRYRQHRIQ